MSESSKRNGSRSWRDPGPLPFSKESPHVSLCMLFNSFVFAPEVDSLGEESRGVGDRDCS